jgi:hypothetical protein
MDSLKISGPDRHENLAGTFRIIFMLDFGWPRSGRVMSRQEQPARDNKARAGDNNGERPAVPEPNKPTPKVIQHDIEFAAVNFQVVPVHFGVLGRHRINSAIRSFVTNHPVGRVPSPLINEGRAPQTHYQDNDAEEIKKSWSLEDFLGHVRPGGQYPAN